MARLMQVGTTAVTTEVHARKLQDRTCRLQLNQDQLQRSLAQPEHAPSSATCQVNATLQLRAPGLPEVVLSTPCVSRAQYVDVTIDSGIGVTQSQQDVDLRLCFVLRFCFVVQNVSDLGQHTHTICLCGMGTFALYWHICIVLAHLHCFGTFARRQSVAVGMRKPRRCHTATTRLCDCNNMTHLLEHNM